MNKPAMGALEKALKINLDPTKYGTIAEIGAGQEVARHFFQAGAAAGTIAKTISAYDMKVSDSIYGQESCRRYVSRSRAQKMIDYEYDLLIKRLHEERPENSTFFSFADTVTARSYNSNGECHGWLAIKLQLEPGAEPCEIMLHVRMFDNSNQAQQHAIGVLGVNLIYGAFYHYKSPQKLINSLSEGLGGDRIEIDYINFKGPQFNNVDNQQMVLHLVESGLANAVMFLPKGEASLASEELYKKDVLALRGTFRPVTKVNVDMAEKGLEQFISTENGDKEKTEIIFEMNMATYIDAPEYGSKDMLNRISLINTLGYKVIVSHYLRYFRLSEYFAHFCRGRTRFITSVDNVKTIFEEHYYQQEEGGLLAACGKLFSNSTKLYVYPNLLANGKLQTLKDIAIADNLKHLFLHLIENNKMIDFENYSKDLKAFHSHEVAAKISLGDNSWKDDVPDIVAEQIIKNKMFGYKKEIALL